MSVVFGMPTLIELSDISDNFALCKELGLDFIEINMNLPQYQVHSFPVQWCKRLMQEHGKFLTIHLDENVDACNFNSAVANAYLGTMVGTIGIAKELRVPVINMHFAEGVYFTLPDKKVYLFEKYRDHFIERVLALRETCEKAIAGAGVTICIENCGMFQEFQREGIRLLLKSPAFALTYDIGHDYSADDANEQFILANADKLKHMHIHDATRTKNHMVLGTGEVDIAAKIELARRSNCRCVLETKTIDGLRQSVGFIHKNDMRMKKE